LEFVLTYDFLEQLQKLTKRSDSGYSSCLNDIRQNFKNQTFDDIYARHYLLRQTGELRLIKIRIPNSNLHYSSAAGYRLIIICNPLKKHVAFLYIYPKKGKYSESDITLSHIKALLKTYGRQLKDGSLARFD
jgi:hypothetical protein